jgi:hypothetical protein
MTAKIHIVSELQGISLVAFEIYLRMVRASEESGSVAILGTAESRQKWWIDHIAVNRGGLS